MELGSCRGRGPEGRSCHPTPAGRHLRVWGSRTLPGLWLGRKYSQAGVPPSTCSPTLTLACLDPGSPWLWPGREGSGHNPARQAPGLPGEWTGHQLAPAAGGSAGVSGWPESGGWGWWVRRAGRRPGKASVWGDPDRGVDTGGLDQPLRGGSPGQAGAQHVGRAMPTWEALPMGPAANCEGPTEPPQTAGDSSAGSLSCLTWGLRDGRMHSCSGDISVPSSRVQSWVCV